MDSRRDSTDGPEDVDAAFAEIVASLERDGVGADWPDQSTFPESVDDDFVESKPNPEAIRPEGQPRVTAPEPDPVDEDPDDHFVPPEPPPLPALRPGTIAALLLMVLGIVLLVAPGLFGLETRLGTPLALVTLCAGIGWLLLRMRQGPPPDSGWDDGAQL